MKNRSMITIAVLLMTAVLFNCNSKKTKSISAQQFEISEPFDITYAEGGGLTGLVESYHITSNGVVEYFQKRPGRQDSLIWSRPVPTDELAKLQQSLLSSTILNQPLNEKGNMTSYLTYATADSTYSLSWPMSEVSPELKPWLTQLKSLIEQ